MAGVKITDLESLANATDSDFLIIIDQSGLETKKISRGEFLREVQIDSSAITSLIDSDYLKSYINGEYIKSHASEDYVKGLVDQDYVLSFVDSDYVALKAPPIPDFGLMEFTAGQNILAGDVLVMNSEGKVVRSTSSGPAINSATPIDLSTITNIPHSVNYYNKFDGLVLYQSGYELYAAKVDSDNSMLVGQPVSTPFNEGVISVSTDNKNGNHFVCFGPRATAVGGYIDSDLSIHFTNTVSLNSYQNVDNWGGDYNYSVYDENENKYIWFSPGGGGDAYKPYQAVITLNNTTSQIVTVETTAGWDSDELQTSTNQIDPVYLPANGVYVTFAEDVSTNSLKAYAGKINSQTGLIEKADSSVTLFTPSSSLKTLGAFRLSKESNQFIVYGNQTHFVNEEDYNDFNNDFFYQIVTVQDLNTMIVGERQSMYLLNDYTSTAMGMAYDENDDSILVFWRSAYNQWKRQLGILKEGSIEFSNASSFNSDDYGMAYVTFNSADKFPDYAYHELTNKIITSTNTYGNDLFSLVFDNSDFQTTNNDFIGIADENISTNTIGKVVVSRGISNRVSGLIPGSSVYLDMTGKLTPDRTRYGVVGRALDSDQVLVTRSHSETLQSQADVLISNLGPNQSLVYDGSKWVNKNFSEIDGLSVDSDVVTTIINSTVTSNYLAENLPEIDAGSAVFLSNENLSAGDLLILNDDNTVSKPSSDGSIITNSPSDISISSVLSQPEIFRNLESGDFITTYTTRTNESGQTVDEQYLVIGSISPEGDVSFGVSYKHEGILTDIITDGTNIVLISVTHSDGVYASLLSRSGNSITEITGTVKLVSLTNTITNYDYNKPKPKAGYNTDNNTFALFCNDEPIKFQIVNGSIVVPASFANRTINGWVSNGGEVKYIPAYGFYVAIIANNVAGYNQLDIKVFDDRGLLIEKENELSINRGSYRISSLGSSPYFSTNISNGNWYFYKISASGEIALLNNGGNAFGLDNSSYSMFAYDEVNQDFIQKDYNNISLGFNQDPPAFPPGASGGVNQLYRKFIISGDEFQYDDFPTYIPGQRLSLFEFTPTFNLFIEGDYQTLNTVDAASQTNVGKFIGFAAEDISENAFGSVTLLGGINRNFSSLIPGPYYTDFFGNVTKTPTEYGIVGVAINSTTMLVNRPLNFALGELDDVSINNAKLTNGQVLTYSGENWSNIDLPKILTKTEIFDLIDVNYVKARLNQIDISELQNVSSVTPNVNQVLGWTGSEWRPKTVLDTADIERMTLDSAEITDLIDTDYLKQTLPPIEAGFKLFEAKGSITAGQVVSLNDDGTVSEIVSDGEVTRNPQINFDATDEGVPLAQNLGNEDMLFVYWDDDNQKSILVPGYINVDGSVGVGDETESVPYEIKNIASNGSQFVLTYIGDNSNAYIIVGEAVGGVISSIGPPQQVTTVSTKSAACTYNSQTNSYVLSYISGESSYAARLVFDSDLLVTVTQDTLLETPYYNHNTKLLSGSAFNKPSFIYNDEYNQLIAVYPMKSFLGSPFYDNKYHFAVLFIDDSGFEFSSASESQSLPAFTANRSYKRIKDMSARIFNSHITIKWNNDYSGSTGRRIYSYTANSQVELVASNGSVGYYGYNSITQKFIDADHTSYTEFYFDTQGDRIDEPFTTTGLSALPNNTNFIFNEHTGFIVEQLNASSVRTIDATIQTTVDDFIGISSENLADGETGSINVFAGINYHVDNLQRGEDYYVTATGELTTTPTDYGIVGKAIDTNAFIITRSAEPVLNDIGDVAISLATLSAGQVLTYTGNSWTNRTPFPPLTRLEVVDLIDNLSINAEGVQQLVNEDYVAVRATPTILSTIDSDYVSSKINLDEEVTAIINQHLGNQDSTDDDNPDGNGSGFISSINQIIDERVDSVFLSSIVDSDYIVDRIDFESIIDKDYIASKVNFDDFFALDSTNQDSNGTPQLTLTDEQIQRNIFTVVDSDYINSRITLDQLFNDTTGDSTSDSTGSFLTGINDLIDARVTSEYIAERFDIADFIASVPDLPVDTDPPN